MKRRLRYLRKWNSEENQCDLLKGQQIHYIHFLSISTLFATKFINQFPNVWWDRDPQVEDEGAAASSTMGTLKYRALFPRVSFMQSRDDTQTWKFRSASCLSSPASKDVFVFPLVSRTRTNDGFAKSLQVMQTKDPLPLKNGSMETLVFVHSSN